jgi:hypothetical protein
MAKVRVLVPHTEAGIRDEVKQTLLDQGATIAPILTPTRERFSYGDALRRAWTGKRDIIICEADVVPPPGAIERLNSCSEPWCSHPIWTGERYDERTTGLVRWSAALQLEYPDLMHIVCAPIDPRYWVRRGWTRIQADCSVQTLNSAGRRATLTPEAPADASAENPANRPTTHDSMGLDAAIAFSLDYHDVPLHVHETPPKHLRDYEGQPDSGQRPWHQLPRDAVDWPTD